MSTEQLNSAHPAGHYDADFMKVVAGETERRICEFSQQNLVGQLVHVCAAFCSVIYDHIPHD